MHDGAQQLARNPPGALVKKMIGSDDSAMSMHDAAQLARMHDADELARNPADELARNPPGALVNKMIGSDNSGQIQSDRDPEYQKYLEVPVSLAKGMVGSPNLDPDDDPQE